MSSNVLSKPIPVDKIWTHLCGRAEEHGTKWRDGGDYREDLLRACAKACHYADYNTHVKKTSRLQHAEHLGIYILNLVCKWLKEKGGLEGMQQRTRPRRN